MAKLSKKSATRIGELVNAIAVTYILDKSDPSDSNKLWRAECELELLDEFGISVSASSRDELVQNIKFWGDLCFWNADCLPQTDKSKDAPEYFTVSIGETYL